MNEQLVTTIDERLVSSLREHGVEGIRLAFVLGSGLGAFADRLDGARAIPYGAIEGMPESGVPGHAGRLVLGDLGGQRVVVQQGRVHRYEGWSARTVTRAVRAFATLGCQGLVLTNAAGGLREDWSPGTLMRIADHIDMQGEGTLSFDQAGTAQIYDPRLGAALDAGATQAGVTLESGVYVGLLGPTYETPAEVRMLRAAGGDAVGMSTVAEAIAARAAGMRVCGISCITNHAAGITSERLSHEEVMETGKEVAGRFCSLLAAATPGLLAATE